MSKKPNKPKGKKTRKIKPLPMVAQGALGIATGVCASVSLFLFGLMIAMLPLSTSVIGANYANWEDDAYPKQTMEQLGSLARAFAFSGKHADDLAEAEWQAFQANNAALAEQVPVSQDAPAADKVAAAFDFARTDPHVSERTVESYLLNASAIEHLADCTRLFDAGRILFAAAAMGAVAAGAYLYRRGGHRMLARALMGASSAIFIIVSVALVWALLDFNQLFSTFHALFFAEGTWTFPSDSLLIQLFPSAFWAAMLGLWVICSLVLSAVVLAAGILMQRKTDAREAEDATAAKG